MGKRSELTGGYRSLVLEGGGMRGVYTSGVLEAFDEAGLRFDSIVACSAGGVAIGALRCGCRIVA